MIRLKDYRKDLKGYTTIIFCGLKYHTYNVENLLSDKEIKELALAFFYKNIDFIKTKLDNLVFDIKSNLLMANKMPAYIVLTDHYIKIPIISQNKPLSMSRLNNLKLCPKLGGRGRGIWIDSDNINPIKHEFEFNINYEIDFIKKFIDNYLENPLEYNLFMGLFNFNIDQLNIDSAATLTWLSRLIVNYSNLYIWRKCLD